MPNYEKQWAFRTKLKVPEVTNQVDPADPKVSLVVFQETARQAHAVQKQTFLVTLSHLSTIKMTHHAHV